MLSVVDCDAAVEREVRADVIRDLRGRLCPTGRKLTRGIRLLGARIVGRLDLDNLTTAVGP
jgi:hypothetical protein